MHFSRAMAFAAFTALKWLSLLAAVLFAALALRFHYDAASSQSITGSLLAAIGCIVASFILGNLARRIMP